MRASSSWLLFAYQVPASPSTHRAYAWRKLKAIGAVYVQNSICILPSRAPLEEKLFHLREEITARGGEVKLLHVDLRDPEEKAEIVSRFEHQMEDEYGEFIEQCEKLHAELAKERDRKHLTFSELEENDEDLAKLRLWLPKLYSRDFFKINMHGKAAKALESCEKDLKLFESEVEAASGAR